MSTTEADILDEGASRALEHMLAITERHGELVAHDFSDPLDVAYLDWLARRSGKTPERYPALFEMIAHQPDAPALERAVKVEDLPGEAQGAFVSNQIVDYQGIVLGGSCHGRAKAHATLTRTKEIRLVEAWLIILNQLDGQEPKMVAIGCKTIYNQQTIRVETYDPIAFPPPTSGSTYTFLSWTIVYSDGSKESSSKRTPWKPGAVSDATVQQPLQNPQRVQKGIGDLKSIVIGLARGYNSSGNNTDVDYWFWRKEWEKTELLVPLVGSIQFAYDLAQESESNPILRFVLARRDGGMSPIELDQDLKKYRERFKIDPIDKTKLNFSLEAGQDTEEHAINFGKSPWVADTSTLFTAQITVSFQNKDFGTATATIMSADGPEQNAADGVTYIKPIVYVWHCLVAGTQITLGDGSTKAVEELESGDEVRTQDHGSRKVLATLAQPHWGSVYVLKLASGKSLTCSGTHPIIAPAGPVAASSLTVGAQIQTAAGLDTVSAISTEQQDGKGLFNLWLDPAGGGSTTMLADGIWVGDYQMQVALAQHMTTDPEIVRATLPQSMLRDYESFLEDEATAASN
jgi:hypothetical protein